MLGEVFFDKLLSYFDDPVEQYKIATLLQLETETKARLRPYLMSSGMSIQEDDVWRQKVLDLVVTFEGQSWEYFVKTFNEIIQSFVVRYKEIAASIPAELSEIHESMVVHEVSLLTFTEKEIMGDAEHSLDDVIAQLIYPLPSPSV